MASTRAMKSTAFMVTRKSAWSLHPRLVEPNWRDSGKVDWTQPSTSLKTGRGIRWLTNYESMLVPHPGGALVRKPNMHDAAACMHAHTNMR
jgi:hypothetical protein